MNDFAFIVEFIRNIYHQPKGFVPLHVPVFNGNEKKYLEECIDTTFVSSVGKFVDRFEEEIALFTGATRAVSCVNGTNALHLALQLVGVDRDSEVITQPLTFIATANAISYCGAHPVFLDVDLDTMGLSPQSLKNWLEQNVEFQKSNPEPSTRNQELRTTNQEPRTTNQEPATRNPQPINKNTGRRVSACVPMHTFGHPCRIDEIVEICNQYNIPVVEDAAESLGSYFKGQHTGTFGRIGILSFNGNKVLTTGGGGMLLFNDDNLAKRAKHLTTQAKVPHPWEFKHDAIGYNYRMPNINAAIGLAQLEQLPTYIESKRHIAVKYQKYFTSNQHNFRSNIQFFAEPQYAQSNYWLNCILFEDLEQREKFLKYTNEKGIMTRPAWTLMNKLPMFENSQCDGLINASFIEERLVNIPSSVILSA